MIDMKTVIVAATMAVAAFSVVPAAHAAVYAVNDTPNFTSSPGPAGTFSGSIRLDGIAAGTFTDSFTFTLPANGLGSGSITTSASIFQSAVDLDFLSVLINGAVVPITKTPPGSGTGSGLLEVAGTANVPITAGALNTLEVTYLSRGNGSYGGNISFVPTVVPEPAVWGMMIAGIGLIGGLARYRRRSTRVAYA